VALLQCGNVHPDLVPEHGDYPELFADLLSGHGLALTTIDVTAEPVPTDPRAFDGWLVSGSACSAYDPLPWIPHVEALLRAIVDDAAPLVAVCFGHQLLAQALGGRVERAEVGWGVGAHRYELVDDEPAPWMVPPAGGPEVALIASHQDQVTVLPDGARVWLRSDHCPAAGYTLGPGALTIQPHPEFTAAISAGLVARRREAIGTERADAALASLGPDLRAPLDRDLLGAWMARFLHEAAHGRAR
jgi:GMP synthase (glutamine-hydrolysing)